MDFIHRVSCEPDPRKLRYRIIATRSMLVPRWEHVNRENAQQCVMSIGCKFCTLWVSLSWLLCACNDPAPVASDGERSTTTQQAADERGSVQHKGTRYERRAPRN